MKQFGVILRQDREDRGLTLREMSKLTGLDHTYIHRLEKGDKSSPSVDVFETLVRTLKLTPRKRQLLNAMLRIESGIPDELWNAIEEDNDITIDAFVTAARVSFRGKRPSTKEDWLKLMHDLDELLERNE